MKSGALSGRDTVTLKTFYGQGTRSEQAIDEARERFREWYDQQPPTIVPALQVSGSLAVWHGDFVYLITVFGPFEEPGAGQLVGSP